MSERYKIPVSADTPERLERLEFLKRAVGEFNTEDFGTPETGYTLTVDFGKAPKNGKPETYPEKGAHPRVLFNQKDIPFVKESIEKHDGEGFIERFKEYLATDVTGVLGEPALDRRGFHNWRGDILATIQAHALAYAVYGEEYYGYSAIYAMKNYLLTLDVDYIKSDQCREFGMVMYITACVYDWCHALLSEKDKLELALGVEHRLCRGSVKNTRKGILTTSQPIKMEMGFPPRYQAALVGHGSEYQLQRDFLAMAIAVYDELPSWYEFVAGRFFNEYVKPRRIYYETKLYPQGMSCYAPHRFGGDCCGAALIQAATGVSPYSEDMAKVLFTFASNETSTLRMFATGDGNHTQLPVGVFAEHALKLSHVLYDTPSAPLLRLMIKQFTAPNAFTGVGVCSILPAEAAIYFSREVAELTGDWREHLPAIWYNGGYVGQYLSRSEWGDNAAVTMTRIGVTATANHDHDDSGTFQIHYKGLTSGAAGSYANYGSTHFRYFHQATVSKNGLLIFDPSLAETEAKLMLDEKGEPVIDPYGNVITLNKDKVFYSGGQTMNRIEPSSLYAWQSGRYDRAKVIGHKEGYLEDGKTPVFSYIAGDITRAYQATQALYTGRAMFTLFTQDEKFPMALVVYDKIYNAKHGLIDKFLLQVNGAEAPVINEDELSAVVEDANGRLVLKNLLGADKIEGIGGGYGQNYVINGVHCADHSFGKQDAWGRIELSHDTAKGTGWLSDVRFLNVLYVTDRENKGELPTEGFAAYDKQFPNTVRFDGARVKDSAILFANSTERIAEDSVFTIPGEGEVSCYVTGVLEGEWWVSYGNESFAITADEESGMIVFRAPAGKEITISMH